jgi:hydrophobe/amphiphile efflux-1 (HAE1) family protein
MVLGMVSLQRLSVDLFPEINIPNVRIATFYAGAGPDDVEKAITQPIERAVSAAPGVDRVESNSKQGTSLVTVWFQYGTNLDTAQFEVQQRVGQILNTLPPGVGQPLTIKFDITNIPVAQVAVTSDVLDEKQLYDLALNVIEPQLERIPGVASATPGGGRQRELQVLADLDALRARGLSILDLVGSVRSSNLLLPSGSLKTAGRDYNVFTNTQVETLDELRDVTVGPASADGRVIRVRDVAEVQDGSADQTEIVRINGARGVSLRVVKQPGANTIAVVDALQELLPQLRGVPEEVKVVMSFDQSKYIRAAVSSLQHEALQGGLFAILIILVFLVSLRATGIVAVAIPLSVISTFVLLYFTGQSLNVFTLGGLALGVGRLVDDSIVELENIHRHLGMGQSRKQAVLAAAQEVAMPILVSTITTIVVFFPVLFLQGVARNLFIPLALTISFALIMSFFVSRTVTPLLCLYWLEPHQPSELTGLAGRITRALDSMDHAYARVLEKVLRHRVLTAVVVVVFSVAAISLFKRIGTEFFPETDEAQLTVSYRTPIGTRATKTEEVGVVVENAVKKTLGLRSPENEKGIVTTMILNAGLPAGRGGLFTGSSGPHAGNLNVNLVPRLDRELSDLKATDALRAALSEALPGVQVFFSTGGIVKRILNFGSSAPIDVEILGYEVEEGQAYAKLLQGKLRALSAPDGTPWLTDLQLSREENYPQLDVQVDRQKAGVLGLSEQVIAQTVLATLVGNAQFAPVRWSDPTTGNEYDINVRARDEQRSSVFDLRTTQLRAPSGRLVSLDTVATVKRSSGPVTIGRKYLQRVIDVTANVAVGKDLGSAAAAVRQVLAENPPPDGFTVRLGGQAEAQQQAFSGLFMAVGLAIALVYMVLASQFRSLVDPLVIMFSVPLGVAGVALMLWATGTTLSVNSFMGIIMMIGIVVSNGVLLVDFANVLQRRGKSLHDATVEAGRTRLRPILMTTLATLVGLAPMALGIGEGSETNLPLARAVIGGLAVSTFLTLFFVPVLYTWLDRFARRPMDDDEEVGA